MVVCEASTKAGKTAGAHIWQLMLAMNGPAGVSHCWVSPIYKQAKRQGYERAVRLLQSIDPTAKAYPWEKSDTELWVRLHNGARVIYLGSDNPDSIYGADYHSAVVDEASRVKEDAWHAVRSTLTKTRGPARIIGNVRGRTNWAWRLGRVAAGGVDGMAQHKLTAWDAVDGGILERAEVLEAEKVLPAHVFKELYLCEPAEDGSNPFGGDAIRACVAPLSTDPVRAWGVDLAKSADWTVAIGLDADGRVAQFHRWQMTPWDQTIGQLRVILGSVRAVVDSTGVGDPIVDALEAGGCNIERYKFNSPEKQKLMQGLAIAIHGREVAFPPGVIVDELEEFEYSVHNGRITYEAPNGLHDDCVMALGLALHGLRGGGGGYFGVA